MRFQIIKHDDPNHSPTTYFTVRRVWLGGLLWWTLCEHETGCHHEITRPVKFRTQPGAHGYLSGLISEARFKKRRPTRTVVADLTYPDQGT